MLAFSGKDKMLVDHLELFYLNRLGKEIAWLPSGHSLLLACDDK
jgi:hypothetical protein